MYEVNTLKQNITVFIIRSPSESDETWTIRPVGQVNLFLCLFICLFVTWLRSSGTSWSYSSTDSDSTKTRRTLLHCLFSCCWSSSCIFFRWKITWYLTFTPSLTDLIYFANCMLAFVATVFSSFVILIISVQHYLKFENILGSNDSVLETDDFH